MLLTVACYFDYREAKIPNWLVLSGLILAVIKIVVEVLLTNLQQGTLTYSMKYFWESSLVAEIPLQLGAGLLQMLLRAGIIMLALYPLYMLGVLGAGDVKLCMVCGAFLKGADCPVVLLKSLFLAAIVGFCKLLFLGNICERIYYFCSYAADIIQRGSLKPYWTEDNIHLKKEASIRMSGPLLAGVLVQICSRI